MQDDFTFLAFFTFCMSKNSSARLFCATLLKLMGREKPSENICSFLQNVL